MLVTPPLGRLTFGSALKCPACPCSQNTHPGSFPSRAVSNPTSPQGESHWRGAFRPSSSGACGQGSRHARDVAGSTLWRTLWGTLRRTLRRTLWHTLRRKPRHTLRYTLRAGSRSCAPFETRRPRLGKRPSTQTRRRLTLCRRWNHESMKPTSRCSAWST